MFSNLNKYHLICHKDESLIDDLLRKSRKEINQFRYYNNLVRFTESKVVFMKNILDDNIIAEYYNNKCDVDDKDLVGIYGLDLDKSEKIVEEKFIKHLENEIIIDIGYYIKCEFTENLKNLLFDLHYNISKFDSNISDKYYPTIYLDNFDKCIIKYINFMLNIEQIKEYKKVIYDNSQIRNLILREIENLLRYDSIFKQLYSDCIKYNIFPIGLAYLHSLFDYKYITPLQFKIYIGHVNYDETKTNEFISNKFLKKFIE